MIPRSPAFAEYEVPAVTEEERVVSELDPKLRWRHAVVADETNPDIWLERIGDVRLQWWIRKRLQTSRRSARRAPQASFVEELFTRLLERWRRDTLVESSTTAILLHPAYTQIIGLGRAALPLILRELEREPSPFWFPALVAVAREDAAENVVSPVEAREKWLAWGRSRGYLD